MEDLIKLAALLHQRNALDSELAQLIGRPPLVGHLGEYIASRVFAVRLHESAVFKGSDGLFTSEPLASRSVNIKWYAKYEGILDLNTSAVPDFYLVLLGPGSVAMSSRGGIRPCLIERVCLFEASELITELKSRPIKIGIATSVRAHLWDAAELYPAQRTPLLKLTADQSSMLALFGGCWAS